MRPVPIEERFWAKVQKTDECWIWTGAHTNDGYGQIGLSCQKRLVLAHRLSYEMHYGDFDKSLMIRHMCHNPSCVRPDHLRTGTHFQNMQDRRESGRGRNGSTSKEHCKHGHEFTPDNTYITSQGARKCRECDRARAQAYRDRKAAS